MASASTQPIHHRYLVWVGLLVALAAAALIGAAAPPERAAAANAAPAAAGRADVILRLRTRGPGLQRLARRVSDPASPQYGRYLAPRQIGRRFGAGRRVRARVRQFFRRRGVRARVDVTRSFAQALVGRRRSRRLFGTIDGPAGRIPGRLRGVVTAVLVEPTGSGQYLPRNLRSGPVASGAGGGGGAALEPPFVRTGTPAGCEQGRDATFDPGGGLPIAGPAFTPNQIQTAYRATAAHEQGLTGRGVRAAILGAGGFGRKLLRGFTECFAIQRPPMRLAKVGTREIGPTSDEGALDLQMLTLMAPGLQRLVVYQVGSGHWAVAFSSMLERRNGPGGRLPHLISVSQGECESDVGRPAVRLTERVLAAVAATGITVAAGSGDGGSFCSSGRVGFYPSSSRWVSSVGGTALILTDSNEIAEEKVWNDSPIGFQGAGGGGFSRYLKAPFYQRGAAHLGRRRGYPDVATMADGFPGIAIYCGANAQQNCEPSGADNPFDALGNGTSAATPLFAGAVALADQRRRQRGGPAIGFANPLLYELGLDGGGGALRDVVEGTNDLGRGCCDATPGFDLASGWGSADAEGLAAAVAPPG